MKRHLVVTLRKRTQSFVLVMLVAIGVMSVVPRTVSAGAYTGSNNCTNRVASAENYNINRMVQRGAATGKFCLSIFNQLLEDRVDRPLWRKVRKAVLVLEGLCGVAFELAEPHQHGNPGLWSGRVFTELFKTGVAFNVARTEGKHPKRFYKRLRGINTVAEYLTSMIAIESNDSRATVGRKDSVEEKVRLFSEVLRSTSKLTSLFASYYSHAPSEWRREQIVAAFLASGLLGYDVLHLALYKDDQRSRGSFSQPGSQPSMTTLDESNIRGQRETARASIEEQIRQVSRNTDFQRNVAFRDLVILLNESERSSELQELLRGIERRVPAINDDAYRRMRLRLRRRDSVQSPLPLSVRDAIVQILQEHEEQFNRLPENGARNNMIQVIQGRVVQLQASIGLLRQVEEMLRDFLVGYWQSAWRCLVDTGCLHSLYTDCFLFLNRIEEFSSQNQLDEHMRLRLPPDPSRLSAIVSNEDIQQLGQRVRNLRIRHEGQRYDEVRTILQRGRVSLVRLNSQNTRVPIPQDTSKVKVSVDEKSNYNAWLSHIEMHNHNDAKILPYDENINYAQLIQNDSGAGVDQSAGNVLNERCRNVLENLKALFVNVDTEEHKKKQREFIEKYMRVHQFIDGCQRQLSTEEIDDTILIIPKIKHMCDALKDECAVCYDGVLIEEDIVGVFSCGHTFCISCINKLLESTCPNCREPFTDCYLLDLSKAKLESCDV